MLAYITRTVDQELLLRNKYIATENRILKALSLVNIRERPSEGEAALVKGRHRISPTWNSLLFFALFADNLVRWWECAEGPVWFWLLSGQTEAVLNFAGLNVADILL